MTRNCYINTKPERKERLELDPVERCLQHPPLPGQPGSTTVDLEVLDPFRIGDQHNAQVLTEQVMQTSSETPHLRSGDTVIAKIYDPLYYNDDDGYLNSFHAVGQSYSHETHAYNVLSEFQGTRIPTYYGSYSLDLPAEGKATRIVRLILPEYINTKSMQQVSPKDYPQDIRQQMLKSIIDFDSLVYERDILLRDLCPRNVLIVEKDEFDPAKDLIFIAFEDTLFGRKRDDPIANELDMFLGQYISPLLRWKRKSMAWEFNDWIDWDWTPWLNTEFAHTGKTITPEIRERFSDV